VATLLALVLLAACGAPATPVPQFTLRIASLATLSNLPYMVMQEQGFAGQNGLQFDETSYQPGAGIIDSLAAGSVDVAYFPSIPLLGAAEHGLIPGTVVAVAASSFTDAGHPSMGVLAAPSANSWKDLAGQYIAVPLVEGIAGYAIKVRLEQEGIQDYTLEEITFANMGLAVAGGNVAAAVMAEPFLTQSLLRGDGKLLGWVIGGPPFERLQFDFIIFRGDFYRSNPPAIKAFLRAHLQAVEWIEQNPEAARDLLTTRLSLSQEVGQKMNLLSWPLDARSDPALLESVQPLLVEIGLLEAPIPPGQLYDETLLEEVLAEK